MKSFKKMTGILITLIFSLFLTACDQVSFNFPPVFTGGLNKYAADNGNDVYFTITVLYDPVTVTCFDTNPVTMSKTAANQWSGTASYSNNLPVKSGANPVSCTGTNTSGSATALVGNITLIPNIPPNIVMLSTQTICGNDGTKNFNEPLVDTALSTYVTGAVYTLTAGSVPTGLSIDTSNGNLIGTAAAGNYTINPLKMTATTMAGVDESTNFSIQINQAACP